MKFRIVHSLSAAVILTLNVAAAQEFTYARIDYPDAKRTTASGINARGDIVGSFTDQNNVQHGFLLSSGVFTPITYPGATATQARGINSRGEIVGTHLGANFNTPGSGGDIHGYVLKDGQFTPVDYPNHMNTITQRITPTGEILGCYHDHDTMGSMHGMQLTSGGFTALDGSYLNLNLWASMTNGAIPDGSVLTGLYTDMATNKTRMFIVAGGVATGYDYPNAIATSAWDMSPSGEIVGVFVDVSLKTHGFLMTRGQFHAIDYPESGVKQSQAIGINPQGDIVGFYTDAANLTHGFLATRTPHGRQ